MSITRRGFLIASGAAGAGLTLGFIFSEKKPYPNSIEGSFQPNAWLQILSNGDVIFQLDKAEMGQGVMTGLTSLIAEELDYEPAQVQVEMAEVHSDYKNSAMFTMITGGSTSIVTAWDTLREAGATARALLLQAAANTWGVKVTSCTTEPGVVINSADDSRLTYGELASRASELKAPASVSLKPANEYRWLGKSAARLDTEDKVLTQTQFGIDVDLPGMKVAVIVRCPHFGGKAEHFDAQSVLAMPGIHFVELMHSGIAIIGDSYWQARQAANALAVTWDKGPLTGLSSEDIREQHEQALHDNDPSYFIENGDVKAALESSSKKIQAHYGVPLFHHSPMEPQNCTALYVTGKSAIEKNKMEIWAGNQAQEIARAMVRHFTDLKPEQIAIHTTFMGGGFGRRAYTDFVGEAAVLAKNHPNVPIKVLWSREDDMQHDFYRPASFHNLHASIDDDGNIDAWHHRIASNSIAKGYCVHLLSGVLPEWVPIAVARSLGQKMGELSVDYDTSIVDGALIPYRTTNKAVGIVFHDSGIPTGFWRSVGHSFNAFAVETMMDELAHLAKQDSIDFRLRHLDSASRLRGVLNRVRELSRWDESEADVFKGVAVHESFLSYVAQVVELVVEAGTVKIQKVYCVADVGFALNPDIVKDQLVSGIIYGLTAAIKAPVKIKDGRVDGSNFHDMPVLRANECPDIEVALIDSTESPTGVGEVGVPPIAPALGNALFVYNGHRQRELPFIL